MEIAGKIYRKDETKTFGEKGFRKREFIIVTDDQYPQHIILELIQDKCDLLDEFNVGDDVKVAININGRLWVNPQGEEKCFNALQGWRIEKSNEEGVQEHQTESHTATVVDDAGKDEGDSLPF